jgi:L-threonylcarbamoyladenylate synthase
MPIGSDISVAIQFLKNDQLIGIPTETVYGLAGNALKSEVAAKIFEVKNRPTFDPLIVHCANADAIQEYVAEIPDWANELMKLFTPGPLTFLLKRKSIIPDLITSGLDRVAIRVPAHPLVAQVLSQLSFPLAAPSANPFGYISPTEARHVEAQLGNAIPYILDGGACQVGLESTIIGEESGNLVVYRAGGLSIDALEKVVGKLEIRQGNSSPQAPGMLKSHYAPKKKLLLGDIETLIQANQEKKISVLSFSKKYEGFPNLVLSQDGNTTEAAHNLFAYMRILDEGNSDLIIAEKVPSTGLGIAINDRLVRAAE